jgi:hypothetical protein
VDADTQKTPIPVVGFAILSRFDLAQRLLNSLDYPIEHLVIVNNSGTKNWTPSKPDCVENLWHIEVPYGLGANGAWNLIIKSTPYADYWVLPNDDSWFEPGALATIAAERRLDAFNFVRVSPAWSCVIPTATAVSKAGLWDEIFYPIYFDDDDYERRLKHFKVPFHTIDAVVHHDNSSTLNSGYQDRNAATFQRNQQVHYAKTISNDNTVWGWRLDRRRENRWD